MMEEKRSLEELWDLRSVKREMGLQTHVDLTLILDGSEAMPELSDRIRACISGFIGQFEENLKQKLRQITRYRVKAIVFRLDEQGQPVCEESPYFTFQHTVDEGMADLLAYLEAIRPHGGCSMAAAAEALKRAMALEYVQPVQGMKARHVLLVLTRAHEKGEAEQLPAETRKELVDAWENMSSLCKRMIIRTTDAGGWHVLDLLGSVWMQVADHTEVWDKEWRLFF